MKTKKYLGFSVINVKTNNFVDSYGYEYVNAFDFFEKKSFAQETIDEIKAYVKGHNNKHSRTLKGKLKHIKVVKVYSVYKIVK